MTTPEEPVEQPKTKAAHQKDPQKVAAGKKGAEARKKKQDALLNQLREAKEKLHDTAVGPTDTHVAGGTANIGQVSVTIPEVESTHKLQATDVKQLNHEPLVWAIGAATVIGGLVWVAKIKPERNGHISDVVPVQTATPILNKQVDPFIMH